MRIGRTCTETLRSRTRPDHTGSPGHHFEASSSTSEVSPSVPSSVTRIGPVNPPSTLTGWRTLPSSTMRSAAKRTGLPSICCVISRRRTLFMWSMAAATAASTLSSSPAGGREAKPSGNSSLMKPVEILPDRHRGCCINAARNGMLCWMPSM